MISLHAYAKLNLTLDITGRAGGYHLLDSLVTTISLYDRIALTAKAGETTVTMRGMGSERIPPESNHARAAAEAYSARFSTGGADIFIEKGIPVGAGLGGSSADIAGVLRGMRALYGRGDAAALKEIADSLGSDAGYLLTGGVARIAGRGERVTPLPFRKLYFLLLVPREGVSTAACYAEYDRMGIQSPPATAQAAARLAAGSAAEINFKNDLCPPAISLLPVVGRALARAREFPYGAGMTGSGSAVFAAFPSEEEARAAMGRAASDEWDCVVAESVEITETTASGGKEITWKKD